MAARRLTPEGHTSLHPKHKSIVERLATEAIPREADLLDVGDKDGDEGIVAAKGGMGYGIARSRSSSREAVTLREELPALRRGSIGSSLMDLSVSLRGSVHESFGEEAFRVQLRRV